MDWTTVLLFTIPTLGVAGLVVEGFRRYRRGAHAIVTLPGGATAEITGQNERPGKLSVEDVTSESGRVDLENHVGGDVEAKAVHGKKGVAAVIEAANARPKV